MSEYYSDYYLGKWSRIVRIRDNHTCYMCLEVADSRRKMEAHHIDRKVDYPGMALDLDNGICLCRRCHHEIVHTTVKNHKQFRYIFKRYQKRKAIKAFNNKWQHKLKYKETV